MKKLVSLCFIGVLWLFSSCVTPVSLLKKGEALNVPFTGELTYDGPYDLIIVPVELNGKSYRFLFDTGAPMVISTTLKEELVLKKATQGGIRDSQNQRQKLEYVRLPDVVLGGVSFSKLSSLVADLEVAPELKCLNIDGIIGANLMRHAHWKIIPSERELVVLSIFSFWCPNRNSHQPLLPLNAG